MRRMELSMIDVPVLIVGGGPVGLTASIYLSLFGVESLLVERHPGTAVLPKARALNARTMEMYRQIGLEDAIKAVAMPARFGGTILWSESLAGREIKRLQPGRGSAANLALSVSSNCGCSQDILEPVLRERAESSGPGRLRFGTQLDELDCSDGRVSAVLKTADGKTEPVRARYLIAADGSQSRIRHQLGIERDGELDVYDSINIHFKADLTPWVADRPAALYLIEQPELRGTFLTINGSNRWGFLVTSLSHYGYTPAQFTPEFCTDILRRAVGADDLQVQVLGVSAWKASALVARQYRSGPVFLAGDAAHEMPPTGGFGLNTGVQDAQNLAWKLAAVLHGEAGDALLDTYDPERRPVGQAVTHTSLLNALSMGRTAKQTQAVLPRDAFLNEIGLVFGAHYESAAVLPDGAPEPVADAVQQYVPSAAPGCRAPHVWLREGDERFSTLDLLGRHFALLCGPSGSAWADAAAALQAPKVVATVIGDPIRSDDVDWLAVYGLDADGAVLVRPDGHVAWRSRSGVDDPATVLRGALDTALCRGPRPSDPEHAA
jgi:2-polyprenyl-6-methoxyphenol hydroxylase-like FAD-dependent oxidoreductase